MCADDMIHKDEKIGRAFAMMGNHLARGTEELFGAYGISVRPSSDPAAHGAQDASVAAMIGYVGHKVRGALVMLASEYAILQWQAAVGGVEEPVDVCDSMCEFSNMLLGRLKLRLLSEGLVILMSTPTAAFGRGLSLAPGEGVSVPWMFEGPGWNLRVRLDATFEAGFELRHDAAREEPVSAGDMILF